MSYFKITITYPNARVEELEQKYATIEEALEGAQHMLGQVQHNDAFHSHSTDAYGDVVKVKPYCLISEVSDNDEKIVFDTRNV